MHEYKIIKVSEQEPRTWDGEHGTVYYIRVMLEGHDRPVEIGKKSPDALKVGDTVYGTIKPTDYPSDSFKAAQKPFGGGGGKTYQPRDDNAIRAQWAIGQAVSHYNSIAVAAVKGGADAKAFLDGIEETAKELYQMVDRVKASEPEKPEGKRDWSSLGQKKDEPNGEVDEPIDLSDIPF